MDTPARPTRTNVVIPMTFDSRQTTSGHRAAALAILLAASTLIAAPPAHADDPASDRGRFVERVVDVDGQQHAYRVFVPSREAGGERPPVILFLHGSGERGSDGDSPTLVGLGPHVRRHADDFPAIVVFPQAPADTEWSDSAAIAWAALDAATDEFGGDRDRTYLTGISMGGYGTWELALAQPERFAAIAPVCGGILAPAHRPTLQVGAVSGDTDPYAAAARRLRDVPTWIFHGARDDVVPPEQSRRMAAALEATGAADARYTEFPDANHNSWDPAYATPELYRWMFAQRRH